MKAVDLKRDLAEVRLRQANTLRLFAVGLGFDDQTKLRLPEKMEHSHDFEDLVKHDVKDHEFLFHDDVLKGKMSELAASKARRVWLPKLEAFAGYRRFNEREEESSPGSPGRREETVLGLRLSMHTDDLIESRREAQALHKEAAADFERAAYKRREIEAHVHNELSELPATPGRPLADCPALLPAGGRRGTRPAGSDSRAGHPRLPVRCSAGAERALIGHRAFTDPAIRMVAGLLWGRIHSTSDL